MTASASGPEEAVQRLRFCAFCPNLCRSVWPEAHDEAETPSALSLLAVSIVQGAVADGPGPRTALARQDMAAACRAACPYGVDVPALVRQVLGDSHAGGR